MGAYKEKSEYEDVESGAGTDMQKQNGSSPINLQRHQSIQRHPSTKLALRTEGSCDLQKPLLKKGKTESNFFPIVCALVAVLGSLSLGLALGYTSPIQAAVIKELGLSLSEYSFFGSIVNLGAMAGAIVSGKIANAIGRKGALVAGSIPNIAGWITLFFSRNAYWLYAARLLVGFGAGIVSFSVPTYIAEVATKHLRGTLGAFHQLAVTIGIMLAYLGGLFLTWRILAVAAAIPGVILLGGLCFIPETPRWLAGVDRKDDTILALQKLRGKESNISKELSEIQKAVEISRMEPDVKLSELFTPRILRPLLVGIGLQGLQQLSGVNGIMLYAGAIFEAVGFKSANIASLLLAVLQVVTTLFATILMDKAGRRLLLLVSTSGMALGSFLVGFSFYLRNLDHSSVDLDTFVNVLSLCSLLLFIVAFAFGMGAIPWIIMSEIFPSRVKGLAGSVATMVNWSCSWAVTLTFNFLLAWSSPGCFWLFSSVCLFAVVFVALLVPETRGRTLEQIEAFFR